MPELPEVETIVRLLKPNVQGRLIKSVELKLPRMLLGADAKSLNKKLTGQTIQQILRRGKYIVFETTHASLIIHLGMTGQLTFSPSEYEENTTFTRTVTGLQKAKGVHPVDKHTHLILHLENNERILFRDPRTFGKIILIDNHDWKTHSRIQILGAEPLDLDAKVFLKKHFPLKSIRPIKALLLDQSFICGVGNIYADEALFKSGIHPSESVKNLKVTDMLRLIKAIQSVLKTGIENSGTTFSDYRKPDGTAGSNQERLQVYGRGGKPCRKCKSILNKTTLAQRGTVYCSQCQPIQHFARAVKG